MSSRECSNGFTAKSTAEEVTEGIDGSGLTAIITGASSGIGAETARVFALRGVHVVMGVRNIDTVAAENVRKAIVEQFPSAKIDIINNAGTVGPFKLSEDEIELTFATNYLGHFLLTNLLVETMKRTANESGKEGRIVMVSSVAHSFPYLGRIQLDKINDKYYSWWGATTAYCRSKLAIILHANELARRLKEDGSNVIVNSLHPGVVETTIIPINIKVVRAIGKLIPGTRVKTVQQGAATTCYVALHPQVKGLSGEYFVTCNLSRASSQARDLNLGNKLWDFTINLLNKNQQS